MIKGRDELRNRHCDNQTVEWTEQKLQYPGTNRELTWYVKPSHGNLDLGLVLRQLLVDRLSVHQDVLPLEVPSVCNTPHQHCLTTLATVPSLPLLCST